MIDLKRDFDISSFNTFGMKVKCSCFLEYESAAELEGLAFDNLPQPLKHIGRGSNLLFTGDFPGTLLHSAIKYIKYFDLGLDEVPVAVGSGVIFDDFVAKVCEDGLWGAENLSLIPGEVGAAAVQNIGAYGVEVKDIIKGVVCFDLKERRKVKFNVEECRYAYRDSMFKHAEGRYIVTSVLFRLRRNYSPSLEYKGVQDALGGRKPESPNEVREAICGIRRAKLPDPAVTGSAGSFFKNPVIDAVLYRDIVARWGEGPHYDLPDGSVKVPAAWMIEKSGLKGYRIGGAAVHEKQPLVIVNASGNATPDEIISLETYVKQQVKENFGVDLSPEVEHI